MSKPTLQQRFGLTPAKTIAVAVLGLVLIGLLVSQFVSSPPAASLSDRGSVAPRKRSVVAKEKSKTKTKLASSSQASSSVTASKGKRTSQVATRPESSKVTGSTSVKRSALIWPTVTLQEAVTKNPFKIPVTLQVIEPELEPESQVTEQQRLEQQEQEEQALKLAEQAEIQRQDELAKKIAAERHRLEVEQRAAEKLRAEKELAIEKRLEAKQKHDETLKQYEARVAAEVAKLEQANGIVLELNGRRVIQIAGQTYSAGGVIGDVRIDEIKADGRLVLSAAKPPPVFSE